MAMAAAELRTVEQEAVGHLRALVRFDTTNPPGNERPPAEYVAEAGRAAGLEARVIDSGPGRGNVVLRLRGRGEAPPILLLSHLDVVPAEPSKWTHPPFAAELAAGCVWGRGSVDSKLTTTVQLAALTALARSGARPRRDVVLAATASEEMGGPANGAAYLATNHPELIRAEYTLNEGGGFGIALGGRVYYAIQTAEKGGCPADLVARGAPGHASVPHGDNPIHKLARAMARMADRKMPVHVTPSTRAFVEGIAADQEASGAADVARLVRALLDSKSQPDALRRLPFEEGLRLMIDAMLRNTAALTILEAGTKRNVIPSEARASTSGRPLPGATKESFLAELRQVAGDEVEVVANDFSPGLESELDEAFGAAALGALRRHDPDARLVPYMMTGGTDAKRLNGVGGKVYGFLPMLYEPGVDYMSLCHGHDERISVKSIEFGVRVMHDLLVELAGAG
jgi:acetylornithine deacetylase/succinyl-diaminopimelate desuccinylase-like protein